MKKFYERYWDRESEELGDFKYKWPVLSSFIPTKKCRMLDYGCGKGKILSEVRKMNPFAVLCGADISATARRFAKKNIPTAKILPIQDSQRVPLTSNSCDFVFSLDVIEHVYDTEKVFREFNRLIIQGGSLLVSTPYHGLVKNVIISLFGFDVVFDPTSPHIRFYTKKTLVSLLEKYGFRVETFGYYGRFPYVWRGMYALAKKSKECIRCSTHKIRDWNDIRISEVHTPS